MTGIMISKMQRSIYKILSFYWNKVTEIVACILIYILRIRSVPEHIKIIIDGNRRYAKSQGSMDHTFGHAKGIEKLTKIITMLGSIDTKELSVFALSIENLKRSQQEIDAIYDLGLKWKKYISNRLDITEKVRFTFYGHYDLLPMTVKETISELMDSTKSNKHFLLNIYAPYTSKFEQLSQVNKFMEKRDQKIWNELNGNMNVMVRTSGEKRLSDFLTWQFTGSDGFLFCTDVLWPEFGIKEILIMIFEFHVYRLYSSIKRIVNIN